MVLDSGIQSAAEVRAGAAQRRQAQLDITEPAAIKQADLSSRADHTELTGSGFEYPHDTIVDQTIGFSVSGKTSANQFHHATRFRADPPVPVCILAQSVNDVVTQTIQPRIAAKPASVIHSKTAAIGPGHDRAVGKLPQCFDRVGPYVGP